MAKLPLPDDLVALRAIIEDAALIASEFLAERDQLRLYHRLRRELGAFDQQEFDRLLEQNPAKAQRVLDDLQALQDADRRFVAMNRRPKTPCIRVRPYVDLPTDPRSRVKFLLSSSDPFLDVPGPFIEAIVQVHDEAAAKLAALSQAKQHATGLHPPTLGKSKAPEPTAANSSGSKFKSRGDPASRALAAALALRKAGKPVSVRAACEAAGVDRKNLAAKHPEAIEFIERLAEPDRQLRTGMRDRRTGNLEAQDDSDED